MSKYKYYYSHNNVKKELTRQQFIDALGEALPDQIAITEFIAMDVANYDRAKKELNRMMYSLKKGGHKSSTLLVVNHGCFWIEKEGE